MGEFGERKYEGCYARRCKSKHRVKNVRVGASSGRGDHSVYSCATRTRCCGWIPRDSSGRVRGGGGREVVGRGRARLHAPEEALAAVALDVGRRVVVGVDVAGARAVRLEVHVRDLAVDLLVDRLLHADLDLWRATAGKAGRTAGKAGRGARSARGGRRGGRRRGTDRAGARGVGLAGVPPCGARAPRAGEHDGERELAAVGVGRGLRARAEGCARVQASVNCP